MKVLGYKWAEAPAEDDGDEPDHVTRNIRRYMRRHGWDGPIQWEDPREALVEFHRRPFGGTIVRGLRSGDVLVVPDQTVLFVTASQGLDLLQKMRTSGILVHCINLGADITQGKLHETFVEILSPLAQVEVGLPGLRARAVKDRERRKGRYLGGKVPIGYQKLKDGRLEPDGTRKRLARQALRLKAKGLSLREIAEELRVRGLSISHTAIDRLMKEVGYVGPKSVRPQVFDAPEDD
jgi:putative DNA-invertase from lambdoid prophage Rac